MAIGFNVKNIGLYRFFLIIIFKDIYALFLM